MKFIRFVPVFIVLGWALLLRGAPSTQGSAITVADSVPNVEIVKDWDSIIAANLTADMLSAPAPDLPQANTAVPFCVYLPIILNSAGTTHTLSAEHTAGVLTTDPCAPKEITAVTHTSPSAGEDGVAVTRETFIEFSQALNPSTVTDTAVYAEYAGQPLDARLHVAPDNKRVTLFYDANLPANARVRVTLDGNQLRDAYGSPVDVDGDGIEGGLHQFDYDTLTLTVVPGTSVCGRVFASELTAVNQTAAVNVGLDGVKITVDGMEYSLFTYTDFDGNFCLDPAPAGRFFVHIDGRTAGSGPPEEFAPQINNQTEAYYPFVGKAWESVPGQQTNIGDVHLPLVPAGTLQDVSQTQDSTINAAPSVITDFPEFANVSITVPADSLYSDDGVRGGQVGIAPVAPDRLPGTLPENLDLPIVITIQTDGASNFDVPAPVCFPNLPDPDTGETLAPGQGSALWSFDHDLGRFVINGRMTVTEDGTLVCTDPGVGVRAPGWHGSAPGNGGDDGGSEEGDCENCDKNWPEEKLAICTLTIIGDAAADTFLPGIGCAASTARFAAGAGGASAGRTAWDATVTGIGCIPGAGGVVGGVLSEVTCIYDYAWDDHDQFMDCLDSQCLSGRNSFDYVLDVPAQLAVIENDVFFEQAALLDAGWAFYDALTGDSIWRDSSFTSQTDQEQLAAFQTTLNDAMQDASAGGFAITQAETDALKALPLPTLITDAPITALVNRMNDLNDGLLPDVEQAILDAAAEMEVVGTELENRGWETILDAITRGPQSLSQTMIGSGPRASAQYYKLTNLSTNNVQRGRLGSQGVFSGLILAPNTVYEAQYVDPATLKVAKASFLSGNNGQTTSIPTALMLAPDPLDTDNDGLPDEAEDVVGTVVNNPDTDNDGIEDGAELLQGTNPLDGLAVQTGVIGAADTPGESVAVCAQGDRAVTADSLEGISIFNVFNSMNPKIVGAVDTPGVATDVACNGDIIVVADNDAGVALIDVSDPVAAAITHQIAISGTTQVVASEGDLAYAGVNEDAEGKLIVIDLTTGTILIEKVLSDNVHDLMLADDHLYVLTETELQLFTPYGAGLALQNQLAVDGSAAPLEFGRKLFVNGDYAYIGHFEGYTVLNVNTVNVEPLAIIGEPPTTQAAVHDLATNGNGLGVLVTSFAGTSTLAASVYDTSDPSDVTQFQASYDTAGSPRALQIHNGLAYVADESGLQVVNYLSWDSGSVPPTATLKTNFAPYRAEASSPIRVTAVISDDVQVRHVAFYVDGVLAETDSHAPFEYRFTTPSTDFALQARAVDTGNNEAWTAVMTQTIVSDATAPEVTAVTPSVDGLSSDENTDSISAIFSEEIDPATLTAAAFRLYSAGLDGQIDTADDEIVPGGFVSFDTNTDTGKLTFPAPLTNGDYRTELDSTVTDLAGNPLPAAVFWHFTLIPFIHLGDVISDTIDTGDEVHLYYFAADPGQYVYFDEQASTNIYWKTVDEAGTVLFDHWLRDLPIFYDYDVGVKQLTLGGAYTIQVGRDTGTATGTYQFQLHAVPDPEVFAINVGDVISDGVPGPGAGNIEVIGAWDRYVFNANAGDKLFFDQQSAGTLSQHWWLEDETSAELFNTFFSGDNGVHELAQSGAYTLTIGSTVRPGLGTYQVQVWDVPDPDEFNINLDDVIADGVPGAGAGNIESPAVRDVYHFTSPADQPVFFDVQAGATLQLRWNLVDSGGATVFDNYMHADIGVQILAGGAYTLTIGRDTDYVGTYQFQMRTVPDPDVFNISVGDTVSDGVPGAGAGNIESPGVLDQYLFTTVSTQTVFFDIQSGGTTNWRWVLEDDANGVVFDAYYLSDSGNIILPAGTYMLTVGNEGKDFTGAYQFQLWDVPASDTFAINIGDMVSDGVPGAGAGNIESPGVKDEYAFTAVAGQSVTFDVQAGGTTGINWRLLDPNDAVVFDTYFLSDRTETLADAGTYTLIIGSDTKDHTGTYQLQLTSP